MITLLLCLSSYTHIKHLRTPPHTHIHTHTHTRAISVGCFNLVSSHFLCTGQAVILCISVTSRTVHCWQPFTFVDIISFSIACIVNEHMCWVLACGLVLLLCVSLWCLVFLKLKEVNKSFSSLICLSASVLTLLQHCSSQTADSDLFCRCLAKVCVTYSTAACLLPNTVPGWMHTCMCECIHAYAYTNVIQCSETLAPKCLPTVPCPHPNAVMQSHTHTQILCWMRTHRQPHVTSIISSLWNCN